MTRLPKEEVDLILSWEHPTMPDDDDGSLQLLLQEDTMAIDETRESIREAAEFKPQARKTKFIEFQDWVAWRFEGEGLC